MKVLIDGDVLRYELGAVSVAKEEMFGQVFEKPWTTEEVNELVDYKINFIMERTGCTECEVFLTGEGNFRIAVATIAPYKGQRKGDKPYHWCTVGDRLRDKWGAVEYHGIEADDAMAIRATEAEGMTYEEAVVVASRDKDLRQVPGMHYSWACGEKQPERPVYHVSVLGTVGYEKTTYDTYKLVGDGMRFFYGQLLVGDTVDNIKGCPRIGPVKAASALQALETEYDLFQTVAAMYVNAYGIDEWKAKLVENARLLFLIRDRSWIEEVREGNHIKCYLKQLWEAPYDYSRYDESPSSPVCNESGKGDRN